MATPPFVISETLPADSDLISIFPSQEHPFRDTVESWLTFLSDPTTGFLKPTAFPFPFVIQNTTAGTYQEWESSDAGAGEGPSLSMYRNSASPAASDLMGVLRWYGKDTAGNKQEYGHIRVDIADPTSTSEDGTMQFVIYVAGAATGRFTLNAAGAQITGVLTYAGAIAGLTGTGALSSGSIASGFGSINIGANTLTAGAATVASVTSTGAISGTTGTFSGAVSGTTGTFSSTLTGANHVSTTNIFANSAAATMNLRPSGPASTTGQMTITAAGNVTAAGDITASSDRRLKKSISPLGLDWAKEMVREVQPMTFLRKKNDQRGIGFIAQDVQAYAPELIQTAANGMLSLAYPNMVAILWKVVQDLQEKVAALEAK